MFRSKAQPIDWMPPSSGLAEIYQEVDIKFSFAFVSDKGVITQSHPWVKCRDFLQDVIAGELHEYAVSIWGFTFNRKQLPERNRVCTDKTMLMISQKGIKLKGAFEKKLEQSLLYINYYENMLGLPNSQLAKLPNNTVDSCYKHVWLLEGPKFWISAPHLISLLTLLVRLGDKLPDSKEVKDPAEVLKQIALDEKYPEHTKDNDVKYLRDCHSKIETVLKLTGKLEEVVGVENGFSKLYGWQKFTPALNQSSFHDRSGILSMCKATYCVPAVNKVLTEAFKG